VWIVDGGPTSCGEGLIGMPGTKCLALLLENVGIDKAIRLGDAEVWREAISELN